MITGEFQLEMKMAAFHTTISFCLTFTDGRRDFLPLRPKGHRGLIVRIYCSKGTCYPLIH